MRLDEAPPRMSAGPCACPTAPSGRSRGPVPRSAARPSPAPAPAPLPTAGPSPPVPLRPEPGFPAPRPRPWPLRTLTGCGGGGCAEQAVDVEPGAGGLLSRAGLVTHGPSTLLLSQPGEGTVPTLPCCSPPVSSWTRASGSNEVEPGCPRDCRGLPCGSALGLGSFLRFHILTQALPL